MHTDDSTAEEWRPIPGWKGMYEVSDCGRVRSVDRIVPHKKSGQLQLTGRMLRSSPEPTGHRILKLYRNAKGTTWRVHGLVALAFIGPCPPSQEVCHEDGDPANNHVANLRYDTRLSNCADTIRHGRTTRGRKQPTAKLYRHEVLEIRRLYDQRSAPQTVIAARFGVSRSLIGMIGQRKRWAWL